MPPFRIPFTSKRPPTSHGPTVSDENAQDQVAPSPFGREKPSLALGLKEKRVEPNVFKLSSVNDSGEYLPPSPAEQRNGFWGKSPSTASTAHHSVFSDNEQFTISRDSFDSYRRSFDISGRSPIVHADSFTSRSSLDSRTTRLPRPALNGKTFDEPIEQHPDEFEEVGLQDDTAKPKKKGFLSRFQESHGTNTGEDVKHHFGLLSGRKRGQSGAGNELGSWDSASPRPGSKGQPENSVKS